MVRLEFVEIVLPPANGGKLCHVANLQQGPVRFPALEADQKFPVVIWHCADQRLDHFMLGFDQFIDCDSVPGHAFEAVVVFAQKVFDAARKHLAHTAVVTEQIDDERFAQVIAQPFMGKQALHIEEVTRMLPIKRRHQLARKKVLKGYDAGFRKAERLFDRR
ncbi:Hypothetical protein NGAL_HAMBI2566_46760 [Neorhizobium galegae bv. orientalis]|nr:Hypothetical protein NGAL_HAMBI2566_46760 [Neorhizobium galegae bv. orientalis]